MAKTWMRLRGNAGGRNGSRSWFCSGCQKTHSISRDIEGMAGARKFCATAIRRGDLDRAKAEG